MKLDNGRKLETASNMALEGYDATIDAESISKLWDMLQDPYKNSIGAVVREYVSNSFDAHAEIGVELPVHVKIEKEESGWFWSTEDFGVGLSEERVRDVFSHYLKSTKENTNDMIGAFGIGSKSGLSYTDVVYIRTRYDGVEYEYLLRRGETTPRIDKLFSQPTTERNGTRIKIQIRYESTYDNDIDRFQEECEKQLAYFDNVYFDVSGIANDYKIYKGKTFIARSDDAPFSGLHLCLGKVAYPIDWANLPISMIPLDFALHFEIGELDIIQTREDVKYSPKTKKAILDKIDLLKIEVQEMWESQNTFEIDDIVEYLNIYEQSPKFNIEFRDKDNIYKVNKYYIPENVIPHKDIKKFVFTPFIGSHISDSTSRWTNNPFFEYESKKRVTRGKVGKNSWQSIINLIDNGTSLYRLDKGDKPYPMKNRYIQRELESGDTFNFVTLASITLKNYIFQLRLSSVPKDKWRETIKLYQDTIRKTLISYSTSYNSVTVTDEWKELNKKVSIKPEGSATIYKTSKYGGWDRGTTIKIENLSPQGLFIVGNRDQKEELLDLYDLVKEYTNIKDSFLSCFYTAKGTVKVLEKLDNVLTMEKFMTRENKMFRQIMTIHHIQTNYPNILKIIDSYDWSLINNQLGEDIKNLTEINSYKLNISSFSFIKDVCYPYAKDENIFDNNLKNTFLKIKEYFNGLDMLEFVHEDTPPAVIAKYIMQYNRSVKNVKRFKKLNSWFYISLNEEEVGWLKKNTPDYDLYNYRKLKIVS
jgi:hypothetical protein